MSGRVGRKEHREFTTNIDFLDSLPSGIYQAELHEKGPQTRHSDLAYGEYLLSLEARGLDDVRRIVSPDVDQNYGGTYPQITILPNGQHHALLRIRVRLPRRLSILTRND